MSHQEEKKSPSDAQGRSASGNREKILTTALRLFTEQGVGATPTVQISKEAGVSTGTLFHYFPDKNSLVVELYLSIKRDLAAAIHHGDSPLPTRQRFEQCLRAYIGWAASNREKVRFLNQLDNSPAFRNEVLARKREEFAWISELFDAAVREGVVPDLPREFLAVMLARVLDGIVTLIASGNCGLPDEEIIKNGLAMLWKH